jgi:hypothetical protein
MKRLVAYGFAVALAVSLTGCGGGNDPDSLTKQMISDMNELATAIEKKESADKIKSLGEKMKATGDKLDALKLSPEDKKKLEEKYKKEMTEAFTKFLGAAMANPEGMKAIENLAMPGGKK